MQLLRKSPVNWSPWLLILIAVLGGRIRRSNGHRKILQMPLEGENVSFTCDDRAKEFLEEVNWWKIDLPRSTSTRLTDYQMVVTKDERFSIHENGTELRLVNLTKSDAATYDCRLAPGRSLEDWIGNLLVVKVNETKSCKIPDFPLNGEFRSENKRYDEEDRYRFGEQIRYSCKKGYVLEGEALRTCEGPTQNWTGEAPSCETVESKSCKIPDFPLDGEFRSENKRYDEEERYRFGEQIRYSCNKGYVLEGEALRTCEGPTRNWTGEDPSCETKFTIGTKRLLEEAMVSLERKVSAMEERLAALEAGSSTKNVSSATDRSYGDDIPYFLKTPPLQLGGGQPVSGIPPPPL